MRLFHQASLHLALPLKGVMIPHILFLCCQNNLVDRPEDLKQLRIGDGSGRGAGPWAQIFSFHAVFSKNVAK